MRIIVGITGASGSIYGIRLLKVLKDLNIETHLIISKVAKIVLEYETPHTLDEVIGLAHHYYHFQDISCRLASGSFKTDGMIIAPCTVGTLSQIAICNASTLISRAADVILKERRRLVLLFRETPLNLGHIRLMAQVTEMGGIIAPLVATFYTKPQTLEEMVDHQINRILDLFEIDAKLGPRWDGLMKKEKEK